MSIPNFVHRPVVMPARWAGAAGAICLAVAAAALVHHHAGEPVRAALGQTLVELTPSAGCNAAAELERAGATSVSAALRLYKIDDDAAGTLLPRLKDCGAVRFAVPDRPAGTLAVSTDVPDPLVSSEWWRAAVGVTTLTPPGPGKPVTIVDSGVNVSHPEFLGRAGLVTLNAQEPAPLGGVHGTAVASLVGAAMNGVGIVGIYPESLLQSWDAAQGEGVRLLTSDIVAGVLAAAANGPGVINLSLGGSGADVAIQQAIATAVSKGMLVVAAAGNDGESGSPLTYPASFAHVLTVGATDESNKATSFSSRSRFVDLAAPGLDIVVASTLDQSWNSEAGTSFAAPLVSGAAAWVWTTRPTLDASQLFEVMRRSAHDIDQPGRDDATGYGLLDVPAALAYAAPVRDPLEPNDDVDYVKPGGLYDNGLAALTTATRRSASLVGRLAAAEDPRDVYRVFVPARGRITVTTNTATTVDLALWDSTASTVTVSPPGKARLARGTTNGTRETVTYANTGAARTAYLAVTLGKGTGDATYRVSVTGR